jgi:hypothetical protein
MQERRLLQIASAVSKLRVEKANLFMMRTAIKIVKLVAIMIPAQSTRSIRSYQVSNTLLERT